MNRQNNFDGAESKKERILFLYSSPEGGHKKCAEAVIKALAQIDPRRRFDLTQIEIRNDALGRPSVIVAGVPKHYPTVHISITHAERMAAACAVVMR